MNTVFLVFMIIKKIEFLIFNIMLIPHSFKFYQDHVPSQLYYIPYNDDVMWKNTQLIYIYDPCEECIRCIFHVEFSSSANGKDVMLWFASLYIVFLNKFYQRI